MIYSTCIQKFRNNKSIIGYRLQDNNGNIQDFKPSELKYELKNNRISIDNLKLTSNNRLIDTNKNIKYPTPSGMAYYEKNDKILLCHGSPKIVEVPKFGEGESTNDYGRGFYTVYKDDIELAKEWACSPYNNTGIGYVNTYNFVTSGLNILNFDKMSIIHWIVLTTTYRKPNINNDDLRLLQSKYLIDTDKFDCICGWRCDDTFSKIITTFMDNRCTDRAISEATRLGYLKQQFVLISKKAFSRIKFIRGDKINNFDLYRDKFEKRKSKADKGLNECISRNRTNGKYIEDYIRELKQ